MRDFIIFNWMFFQIVSLGYWLHLANTFTALDLLFSILAFASYLGITCLFLMIPLQLLRASHALTANIVAVTLFSVATIVLISDWNLYNQMRFHINGAAIAILGSKSGIATLNLTASVKLMLTLAVVTIISLQITFYRASIQQKPKKLILSTKAFSSLVIAMFLGQGLLYIYADGTSTTNILSLASRVPFFQPIEVRSYTSGIMTAHAEVQSQPDYSSLDFFYNQEPTALSTTQKTPDIFMIAMDSVRSDLLTNDSAPNLTKFASNSDVFRSHISGGNQTRHGIFSLFYGIPASYWKASLRSRTPPILLSALQQRGYDIQVFSSANLDHPEFKDTVFKSLAKENIHDAYNGPGPRERDLQATLAFNEFIRKKSSKPKFGFLFLDGTHGPYSYSEQARKFTPDSDSYFIAYNPEGQVKALKNQYLNAIYQADMTLKATLNLLSSKSRQRNPPITIITSDHGEEFLEHGYRGHCSAFTPEQVTVPLITRGLLEDHMPSTYDHLTSHEDLVYTIMERLGVEHAADLTSGDSLLSEHRNYALSCGWDQCAVISPDHVTVFGTESYNAMKVEKLNGNYEKSNTFTEASPYLADAFREMTKFFDQKKRQAK